MRSHILKGLLHATSVAIYIAIVVTFIQHAPRWFEEKAGLLGPIAMLLLLVISATITGTLVLGRPILAYLDGKKSEAITLFFATVGWLVAILGIVFLVLALR